MCFEGKTAALARRLKVTILETIDSVDQARELVAENKRERDSQIARMAELYYENPEQFGIKRALKQVSGHPLTKKSALRGAIVEVLKEFINTTEELLDAEALGPHDVNAGSELVIA